MDKQPASMQFGLVILFVLTLSGCGGGGNGAPADTAAPTLDIGNSRIDEGDSGATTISFTVSLSNTTTSDVTVDYNSADDSADAGSDYTAVSGTLVIPSGDLTATISVSITGEKLVELDESFSVILSRPQNAALGISSATGTITNDDFLLITFAAPTIVPGGNSTVPGRTFSMDFNFDIALLADDLVLGFEAFYAAELYLPVFVASGTITIIAGTNSGTISFDIPPGLGLAVGGAFEIRFIQMQGTVPLPNAEVDVVFPVDQNTINLPDYSIARMSNATVLEGDTGSTSAVAFTLVVDPPLPTPVVVSYLTGDATANEPQDYTSASGTITVPANQPSAELDIVVIGDDEIEGLEAFLLGLRIDSGDAVLDRPVITGFITDDDVAADSREITVSNAELIEGDSGTMQMTFDITLDAPAQTTVSFSYSTRDDSATAGSDYTASNGNLTFQPGEDQLSISIPILGDTDPEEDERFIVEISGTSANVVTANNGTGTILTDDPLARITIDDLALAEGDTGTTDFVFRVNLNTPLNEPLILDYSSADITTTAVEDYTAVNTSITIPAGDIQANIVVTVNGDTDVEDDEVFSITLTTGSSSAIFDDAIGEGTILNDDGSGGWAGEEEVHTGSTLSTPSVWPDVAFGSGAERHVVFAEFGQILGRRSSARTVWSTVAEVGTTPLTTGFPMPKIVASDAGEAIAVWSEDTSIDIGVYSSSGGWVAAPLPVVVEGGNPDIAIDRSSGEAFLVWYEPPNTSNGNFTSIWASRYVPGSGWQDTGLVETADGHTANPQVVVPPNGEAIVVFSQPPTAGGFTDIVAYQWSNGSWQGPTILDNVDGAHANIPQIAVNAAGDAAVSWYQEEPVTSGIARESIYVNRYDASSGMWSGADLVENNLDQSTRQPDVAIDAGGNVFVIWLQDAFTQEDLWANRYDDAADNWSGPELLELDDTASGLNVILGQQVVADDLGNAIAVWVQDDGTLQNVRSARYSAADVDWQPAELLEEIDTGDANWPQIAIDRTSGDAMVVWHHSTAFSGAQIRANRYTNQ